MWSQILTFLAGAATAIFAEPIRQWLFRPKLLVEFVAMSDDFVTRTREQSGLGARYIRIRVANVKSPIAKSCRVYLVKIEQRQIDAGEWFPSEYSESLQLAWSGRPSSETYAALDLPMGVPHFADVLSVRERSAEFVPALPHKLYRYENLYKRTGEFRFTVAVSGDGVPATWIRLIFTWNGAWDTFNVFQQT